MAKAPGDVMLLGRAVGLTPSGWAWRCFACGDGRLPGTWGNPGEDPEDFTLRARRVAVKEAKAHECPNLRTSTGNKLRDPSRRLSVVLTD